jgi:hypothetical protein
MLKISPEDDRRLTAQMVSGNKADMPGLVRASLGCYTNEEDLNLFLGMLERIAQGDYRGKYVINPATGIFSAKGFAPGIPANLALHEPGHHVVDRFRPEAS